MKRWPGLSIVIGFCCCAAGGIVSASPQETATVTEVQEVQVIQSVSPPYPGGASAGSPSGAPTAVQVQSMPPGVQPGIKPSPSAAQREPKGSPKPGSPPSGAPGDAGTPGADGKPSATVKRIDKPQTPADPKEFEVRPGPDGLVHFQFRGQKWPDLLEWYAEIAGVSVDWLELPGDYLNISTQRGYTVEELGELFNRLLLARGFTMLPQGEFINVVKCEELTASLVPRVQPGDLEQLGDYEFVRVMFDLDWMLAADAITELDPLLSSNGKLFPLTTTNRVEAMDAACNLREIHRLLSEEQQSEEGEPRLVKEFSLRYARADEVRESLTQFLGLESSTSRSTPGMSPQQMAKQQQQMMQMQQQMAQQMAQQQQQMQRAAASSSPSSSRNRRSTPGMPAKEMPVRMMVNRRRNSLLVQAPPDKMATIAQAIQLIDVPEQGDGSLQSFLGRMQVYRMAQIDPQKLVESLTELGGLDPTTRLEVDEVNRAIIAYATPADHFTIRSTVEKLDGSARRVEVIPLRRLAADEVAGTIQYLMAGEKEDSSSSRSNYMDYVYGYRSGRTRTEKTTDEFRVDADVANNRLLVKANDMELEEVVSILVKLGEVPRIGRNSEMTRVLDIAPGADADAFLKRLESDFKSLAPNRLVIPPPTPPIATPSKPESSTSPTKKEAVPAEAVPAEVVPAEVVPKTTTAALPHGLFQTALFQQPAEPAEEAQETPTAPPTAPPTTSQPAIEQPITGPPITGPPVVPEVAAGSTLPPVNVTIGPDGRLVISSQDAQALELLEELAVRIAPPPKDYEIFRLKSALASWVVLNLEEFFEDEDEAESRRRNRMSYLFGMSNSASGGDERRLSKRKPLKFISDLDTNTILVQGADAQQLKTIADLIKLYDVPEPVSSQNARVTKLFTIKYSRASIVADTIKDAYRDLLSSNDRALQNGGKEQGKQPRGGGMTVISAFGLGDDTTPADSRTSARFEGKLSIGVDDVSNTMLVSTEGENLMSVVEDMITALDEAAMPVSEVRVVKVGRHVDGSRLQEVLDKVLNNQMKPGQANAANAQPKPEPGQMPGMPDAPPGAGQRSPRASRRR